MKKMMFIFLSLLSFTQFVKAQTTHPCDIQEPLTFTVSGSTVTVQSCWNGMYAGTPPVVVVGATWNLIVDGVVTPLAMTKTGAASTSGQYLYTSSASLTIGTHIVDVQIVGPTGGASRQAAGPITVTVNAVQNTSPIVNAGPNINIGSGQSTMIMGTTSDDGLPLVVSPDGLRVPTATRIIDQNLGIWTLGVPFNSSSPDALILLNGSNNNGGAGSILLWYQSIIYTLGTDKYWYSWNPATSWTQLTPTDPGPILVPVIPLHVTTSWTKTSGPGTVTFSTPNQPVTSATFSLPGTYIVRLTGSDGSLSSFDELTVTVPSVSQSKPTVTLILPSNGG